MGDRLKTIVRVAFIAIGVALLAKFSFDWVAAKQDYDSRMDAAASAIASYQSEILANQKILDDTKDEMQVLSGNLHDMSVLGKAVADLQTDFANYSNFYGVSQVAAREGTGVTARIQEVQEGLLEYFDEDDVYVWYDWNDKVSCQWECVTSYSFYGDSMKVMWICRPYAADLYNPTDSITVYAYATADYDFVENKFSNLETAITKPGAAYLFTYEQSLEVADTSTGQIAIDRNNGLFQDEDGNYDYEIMDEADGGSDPDDGEPAGDGMDTSPEQVGPEEPDGQPDEPEGDGDEDGGGDIFG